MNTNAPSISVTRDGYTAFLYADGTVTLTQQDTVVNGTLQGLDLTFDEEVPDSVQVPLEWALVTMRVQQNTTDYPNGTWIQAGVWAGVVDDSVRKTIPHRDISQYWLHDRVYIKVLGVWHRGVVVQRNQVTVKVLYRNVIEDTWAERNARARTLRLGTVEERHRFPLNGSLLALAQKDGFTALLYAGGETLILQDGTARAWAAEHDFRNGALTISKQEREMGDPSNLDAVRLAFEQAFADVRA